MSVQRRDAWTLLALGVLFLADRFLKLAARRSDPIEFGPLIAFRPTENLGIAFSIPVPSALAQILIAFVVVLLTWMTVQRWRSDRAWIPWALLTIGGGSNLIDRVRYGVVIDYFDVVTLPVFNLADVLIVVGLLSLLVPRLTRSRTTR